MAYDGAGETLVVIDDGWSSGFSSTWQGDIVYQYDFADGDGDAQSTDTTSHGGAVASTALSVASNVDIIQLKVFEDGSDSASTTVIEEALDWVIDHGADYGVSVVNLSLGSGNYGREVTDNLLSDEFAALADAGIVSVAAAGNDGGGRDGVAYPAADANTLAVSASDGAGAADWTQYDPGLTTLFAQGVDVTIETGGDPLIWSGTSFAAPQVAGAMAILNEASNDLRGANLSLDEAIAVFQESGDRFGDADPQAVLDVEAALDVLTAALDGGSLDDLVDEWVNDGDDGGGDDGSGGGPGRGPGGGPRGDGPGGDGPGPGPHGDAADVGLLGGEDVTGWSEDLIWL